MMMTISVLIGEAYKSPMNLSFKIRLLRLQCSGSGLNVT